MYCAGPRHGTNPVSRLRNAKQCMLVTTIFSINVRNSDVCLDKLFLVESCASKSFVVFVTMSPMGSGGF